MSTLNEAQEAARGQRDHRAASIELARGAVRIVTDHLESLPAYELNELKRRLKYWNGNTNTFQEKAIRS